MQRLSTADCTSWIVTHDPLEVTAWADPLVEQLGHAPRSAYVETYWLPLIGPASTWAMRRLNAWLDGATAGYQVSITELGRELGLGAGVGRSSPVVRTLARLVSFGLATPLGDALAVRRMLAPLTCRQVRSLPEPLAIRHDQERAGERERNIVLSATTVLTGPLCGTASVSQVSAVVGDVHRGDAGGAVVRSGKPAAALPGASPAASHPAGGASR
jgi:hypothetical protein